MSQAIPIQSVPSAITASHIRSFIFFRPVVPSPLIAGGDSGSNAGASYSPWFCDC